MFQTKITTMLGIKYPIVVGAMMHLGRAEMAAAASNAGALGVLTSAIFQTKEDFRQEVKKLKGMTDKPFAVNLTLTPARRPIDNRQYLEVIFDEGIRIVETSGREAPEQIAKDLQKHNIILMHKCVGVRYALKAQSVGANIVTVVGYENGGATGTLDITTLCLVPRVVDALSIPVIGGGGVADGRGFLALLALGAEGVIMGTPLLVSEECPIHPRLKQALIEANELDTMIVMRSIGNTHRVWINEAANKVAELEKQQAGLEAVVEAAGGDRAKKMYEGGDIQGGIISCGQGIGLVKKVMPMKEIIEKIVNQADALRKKLAAN
jgi:NAD(P)H-dependent flavin oxidoreductase YrpB (nitropropane dioxygenase family)